MLADPEMTIKEVAGVNRATIYRSLDLGRTNSPASARGIISRLWTSAAGRSWGGKPLSRGAST